MRALILILVAIMLVVGILVFSVGILPDPPVSPTPTFPQAIDFPNDRTVPR